MSVIKEEISVPSPNKIHMKLNPIPFEKIASGRKSIELRLHDEKRRTIQPGDTIVFTNLDNDTASLETKVLGLSWFTSFEDLLTHLDPIACGWENLTSAEDMASQMRVYYSEVEERRWGVVGIHLEVIRPN